MYKFLALSTLLAAAAVPSVSAGKRSAVGYFNTNSAGFGSGGTTVSSTNGINLYDANNKPIGNYSVCDSCKPVCSVSPPLISRTSTPAKKF